MVRVRVRLRLRLGLRLKLKGRVLQLAVDLYGCAMLVLVLTSHIADLEKNWSQPEA